MNVDQGFSLNGEAVRLMGFSPTMTLLEFLRRRGLTSAKEGCGDGDCGACTVAMLGRGPKGEPSYQAVNSCLVMLGSAMGREVLTAEGIGRPGALHPVQAAMAMTGGSQCGYCTPGFVMSMFAAYYEGSLQRGADDVLEGNLCRCTGYNAIRRAAQELGQPPQDDPFLKPLARAPDPESAVLETAEERFLCPTTLQEVLALWREHPGAKLMAGATDLGLDIARRHQRFPVLIALEGVRELQGFADSEDALELGAGLTLSELAARLGDRLPGLEAMLHLFAGRQIRNRATIGGNLGTASPIGDLAPVLLALGAEVILLGPAGERRLPITEFFTGYRQTALQPGELIARVRIPKGLAPGAARRLSHSYKVSKRPADDISTVAASFALDLSADGRVMSARLAYGGVAAIPARAFDAERALEHRLWNADTVEGVRGLLLASFTPLSDVRASARYRQRLVANLFEKFFHETAGGVEASV